MESGIIAKNRVFIGCDEWKHIVIAYQNNTSRQFILCRNDEGYGTSLDIIDIVGMLNKEMLNVKCVI